MFGGHPWGDLLVARVDRAGGARYHLTVFPPGISAGQRRALAFRSRWIPWGAIAAFVVASGLGTILNGWIATAVVVAIYVGALLAANKLAGVAGRGVVEVDAQRVGGMRDPDAFGDLEVLQKTAARLLQLDDLVAGGQIGHTEYERLWRGAYDEIVAYQNDAEFE